MCATCTTARPSSTPSWRAWASTSPDFRFRRRPGALATDEVRYYVPANEVDPDLLAPPGEPMRLRACIENATTGKRWLELPEVIMQDSDFPERPSLHVYLDRGGRRLSWDPLDVRQVGLARDIDAGRLAPRLERSEGRGSGVMRLGHDVGEVHNLAFGPFMGAAGSAFFNNHNEGNELFQWFFDELCDEMESHPLDYGSARHQAEIWSRCRNSIVMQRKCRRGRMGRWSSLFAAVGEYKGNIVVLLMVLVYVGIQSKFWVSVWESPLGKAPDLSEQTPKDEVIAATSAAGGAAASSTNAPKTVRESNQEVEEKRGKANNTLELSVVLLANGARRRTFEILAYLVQPYHRSFGEWQVTLNTQRGALELHLELATGQFVKVIHESIAFFAGREGWARCGFSPHGCKPLSDDDIVEEQRQADMAFKILANLINMRLVTALPYCWSFPGIFAKLVHPSATIVGDALCECTAYWSLLLAAEARAHMDSVAKQAVAAIVRPKWVWVREIFVLLAEYKFEHVPTPVRAMMLEKFGTLGGTQINEEAMDVLRTAEQRSERKALSAPRRWSACQQSCLIRDYDFAAPPVTTKVRHDAAAHLPKTLHHADHQDFSCGMELLTSMASDESWTSVSLATWSLAPVFTHAWKVLEGDWAAMDGLWRALLVRPGSLILRVEPPPAHGWLVVRSTRWGAIGWKLKVVKGPSGFMYSLLKVGPEVNFELVPMSNAKSFRVARLQACPPAMQTPLPATARSPGLVLVVKGAQLEVYSSAAQRAFPGLTVPFLRRALDDTGLTFVAKDRPRAERHLLEALLRFWLPGRSDAERSEIIASRVKRVADDMSSSLLGSEASAKLTSDPFEQEGADMFKKSARRRRKPDRTRPPPPAGRNRRRWLRREVPSRARRPRAQRRRPLRLLRRLARRTCRSTLAWMSSRRANTCREALAGRSPSTPGSTKGGRWR